MGPDNLEVLDRPGLTIIRYRPLPLAAVAVYPWGTDEPDVKVVEAPR